MVSVITRHQRGRRARYPTLTGLSASPMTVDISSGAQVVKIVPSIGNASIMNWNNSSVSVCRYSDENGYHGDCYSGNFTSTGDNAAYVLIAPSNDSEQDGDYGIQNVYLTTNNDDYLYLYRYDYSWRDIDLDGDGVNDTIAGLDSLGIPKASFSVIHKDADSDGDLDYFDAFPLDATESLDTDRDGVGNNTDTDDDGDGVEDSVDAFPLDPLESVDSDFDGIGDNAEAGSDTTAPTITSITASRTTVDEFWCAGGFGDANGYRCVRSSVNSLSLRLNHSSDSYSTTKYSRREQSPSTEAVQHLLHVSAG